MSLPDKILSSQEILAGLTPNWDFYPISGTNMGFMKKKVTTLSRLRGKADSVYRLGPCRESKIKTPDESWGAFDKARAFLSNNNYYGFLLENNKEGVSIWLLAIDDSFTLESFGNIVNPYIKQKKWNRAFIEAQAKLKNSKDNPFAIIGVLSASLQDIPWFGRCAWGTGYSNGILSLTQIPTMAGNKEQYCTWSFVCKDITFDEDTLYNTYTKGGNENTYTSFKKYRDFLLSDKCEPANPDGNYEFLKNNPNGVAKNRPQPEENADNNPDNKEGNPPSDNKEGSNPLVDAAKKEGFFRSRTRSLREAQKHLVSEYRFLNKEASYSYDNDEEEDDDEISDTETTSPKSQPFVCTIRRQGANIPIGPLY